MNEALICDAIRTPIGRYGGALSSLRTDDLAAVPIKALIARNAKTDWDMLDDVIFGCANQAGEDNRNVARMAALLAGLPQEAGGATINRLCGSGLNAVADAARAIKLGEAELMVAGGVESMSRAPFVLAKSDRPFDRRTELYDTTIGWRFVNPEMEALYGTDSMPQTAENVAQQFGVSREDQDAFAARSQARTEAAITGARMAQEIAGVELPPAKPKNEPGRVDQDEHPRPGVTLETLGQLRPLQGDGGTVTAGNASGVNDGACALLIASESTAKAQNLTPLARIVGTAVAGLEPRIMGMGPVPATNKLLLRLGLSLDDMDVIELNEAFAAQALAVLRELGLADDAPNVNPNGGAIALGHPLGMTGARLVTTAAYELARGRGKYALCTMCIGVGQGISMVIERV